MSESAVTAPRHFAAFISYRHLDNTDEGRRWAEWLHHWIESYRVPRSLVGAMGEFGAIPARVSPVFRDEWEMRGGGELSELIEEGLRGSDCLIVLCSPRSATSHWVLDEVKKFKALGKEERIIPVLIEGEPGAADAAAPDDMARRARECLPETLRRGVRAIGPPTADGSYPLDHSAPFDRTPCDFRPKGTYAMGYTNAAAFREELESVNEALPELDRRSPAQLRDLEERYAERLRLERLRIVAGLLGVTLEVLNQRDAAERARRWRRLFYLSAAIVVVIALLGFSVWLQSMRRQQLLTTASDRDHAAAEQALINNDWPLALAYLDRALTYRPDNTDAATFLWSLLRYGPAADAFAARQLHALAQPVQGFAWSPDSRRLMVCLAAGEVRILDVQTGNFLPAPIALDGMPDIHRWTADGSAMLFVTPAGGWWRGTEDNVAPLHLAAGSARPLLGEPFSPDGKQIIARMSSGNIEILDAETGKALQTLTLATPLESSEPPRAAWRPDGRAVLLETPSGSTPAMADLRVLLREFSTETGQPASWDIPSKRKQTAHLRYSPSGRYVLVDQGAAIGPTGETTAQIEIYEGGTRRGDTSEAERFEWHPLTDQVFLWGHLYLVRRRPPSDLHGPSPAYDLADPGSIALDRKGQMLVIAAEHGGDATLYDAGRFKPRAHWTDGAGLEASHSLSPDGRWWVVVMNGTELIVCRVASAFPALPPSDPNLHPLPQPADQQSGPSEKNGYLVSFAEGDELVIRRAATGRLVGRVTTLAQVYRAVGWSADASKLVCTTPSGPEFSLEWKPPGGGDKPIQRWALAVGGRQLTEAGAAIDLPLADRIAAWQAILTYRPADASWMELLEWWRAERPLPNEPP